MPVNHSIRGASAASALAWTICAVLAAQSPEPAWRDTAVLLPDQTIERALARGQEHRYQLALNAGESARVIVEQRGIDVVVQARGPEGALLAEVQDEVTNQGYETVDLVADADGPYILAIAPAPGIVVAGSYAIRLDSRRAATAADRAAQDVRTLRAAATQRVEGDDWAGAASLLERALTLAEDLRGPDDREVADVAAQLADVYLDLRDTVRAEPLYRRALGIMDDTLGREHPAPAFVRSRLARLYQLTGERLKAEALIRQGLAALEHSVGPDHLLFVRSLITLQALRENARDFDQAGEIIRRQLAILEKIGYEDSVLYAQVLSGLGGVYNMQHDARAEQTLQRALSLCETLRGRDAPCAANPLVNLGVFAHDRRDNTAAEAYYRRAFAIRAPIIGAENPDLIPLLNNLANVYHSVGDDARALETHFQALHIEENALGPYHRYALLTAGNIAIISAATGDLATAIAFQRRTDAIVERQLALNMAVGSERQKLAFARGVSERTDRTISLHLNQAPDDPDAGALAALVVLQRKGRVLDAMTDMLAAARQRVTDPKDQALLDQLNTTTAHLAQFALSAPEGTTAEARQAQIAQLDGEKERLEGEIGARDAEFRAQTQPVTLRAVQAAIPDDAALLEFAVFRPFDPVAQNDEAYGPPHYAAYVVRKHGAPRGVDLGPARTIDGTIAALREALREPARRDLRPRALALAEQVLRPLQAAIGNARRLLVSPDGNLNLVPFEALVDAQGRYLIERYAITYLTSGRDLLRMQVARASRSAPVIVADPLFGAAAPAAGAARRSDSSGDDLSTRYFAPLAATAAEGRAIKRLFPEATLLTGGHATKAAMQRAEAPRMLHIASHGFFLREPAASGSPSPTPPPNGVRPATAATVPVENPLLRSGLALAGANLTHDPNGDGILTALEAAGLNLWGTKLVTLSACDTGVGEVATAKVCTGCAARSCWRERKRWS